MKTLFYKSLLSTRGYYLLFLFLFFAHLAIGQGRLQVVPDTIKVMNAELVIRNNSKDVQGFLYNAGNGVTEFKPVNNLKSLQFKVGVSPDFPIAGDSLYTNAAFIKGDIKVWKNGVFQYRDSLDGILFDTASGKITFHPAFAKGDKIYIEGYTGSNIFQGSVFGFSTNLKLHAGLFDHGDNTFTLRWATSITSLSSSPKVTGIGSSTLAGTNLSMPNRIGDKILSWLTTNTSSPTWINLAVAGYNSESLQRVIDGGISGNNIESALNSNPDFIFLSLASNDPGDGISIAQTLANYRKLDTIALNRGVPIFFETTQPRTQYSASHQTMLRQLADSIRMIWPDRYVEGFNDVVDVNAATSAAILAAYTQVDGIHLNSAGNQFIANRLFLRWQDYFRTITGVSKYIIETSTNLEDWTEVDVVADANIVKKIYSRPDNQLRYYRVKAVYVHGVHSPYSNVTTLQEKTAPTVVSGGRVLIDLGGDGVTTKNGSNLPDGKPTSSPDNTQYWNNWYGAEGGTGFVNGAALNNLVTTSNGVTAMGIKLIGNPSGTFGTAATTKAINFTGITTGIGDYPLQATYDNMFLHNSANSTGVTYRIMGLTSTKTYSIKLWGARLESAVNTRILETKLGTESWSSAKTVDTWYANSAAADYDKAIVYTGITGVDSVDINLRVGSGSSFAHISVIDIDTISQGGGAGNPTVLVRDSSVTLPKDSILLSGIINANGSTISTYQWSFLSGPNTPTIVSSTSQSTYIKGLTNGVFQVRLTITSSTGYSTNSTATISVYPNNEGKKTMRVYFSATQRPAIPGWMNAYGNITTTLVSFSDPVTNWGINSGGIGGTGSAYWVPSGNNATDTSGHITGNNSGIVPDIALDGYWFNNNKQFASGTNNVIITGLDSTKTYTIKLVGSRSTAATSARYSAWHINDGPEILQNVLGNTSLIYTQTGISPTSAHKINIGVYTPVNTGTNGNFSFINALIVQEE